MIPMNSYNGFIPFFVDYKEGFLHGNMTANSHSNRDTPKLLFLHGEQPDQNINDYLALRQVLFQRYDLNSCGFDFLGHGNSAGYWRAFNLHQRLDQADEIVNACFDCKPFGIVASYMSVDTAIRLAAVHPVETLTLIPPDFKEKDDRLTGATFAQIDVLKFWQETDVFDLFKKFKGKVSILNTGSDGIKHQINMTDSLYKNACYAEEKKIIRHDVERTPSSGRDLLSSTVLLDAILELNISVKVMS